MPHKRKSRSPRAPRRSVRPREYKVMSTASQEVAVQPEAATAKRTEAEIYEILKEQNWRALGDDAAINRAIRQGTALRQRAKP